MKRILCAHMLCAFAASTVQALEHQVVSLNSDTKTYAQKNDSRTESTDGLISQPGIETSSFSERLVKAALERTKQRVVYDGSYFKIAYPGGDVPRGKGVCTDVIVRSYRALGVDLQRLVHEDMKKHFHLYPKLWGLKRTDTNIDHRRVPNLRVFFQRFGKVLPLTQDPKDYAPGDLVTWNLTNKGSIPHIGIVSDQKSSQGVPLVVHNIGGGTVLEDILFDYKITGHYQYQPSTPA